MSLSPEATHTFFLGRSILSGILTYFACSLPPVWLRFVWCLALLRLLLLWCCRWKIILLQALSYPLLFPLCGHLSWQILCICPSPPTLSTVSHPLLSRHLLIRKRASPFSALFHCDLAAVSGSVYCSSGSFKFCCRPVPSMTTPLLPLSSWHPCTLCLHSEQTACFLHAKKDRIRCDLPQLHPALTFPTAPPVLVP